MKRVAILEAVSKVYDKVFNQGNADLLRDLVGDSYVQHNPGLPDGTEGIIAFIKQVGSVPCEVKRIAVDGDLAFVHVRYLNWMGSEHAGVDIFRFDANDKIVEHWDVLQQVPTTTVSGNTMF